MAGPKLLDKKVVNAEVATQKKHQIDSGLALAKKVDALRETLGNEEQELELFRSRTIAKVQQEIDIKISERDALERSNAVLREDRIRLSAPIDLSQAWEEVKHGKREIVEWKDKLTEQSVNQLAREADIAILAENLLKKENNIEKKDILSERTLSESEQKFTQASDTLERAQRESNKILENAKEIDMRLKVREEDVTNREIYLSEREEKAQTHEVDLANREIKFKSRQEVFIRAQNYIKNKK